METFFNKRNGKVSDLNLLADSLGHSLREGVALFSIDDSASKVTFVTESGKIIEGNYYISEDTIILENIENYDGEVFKDDDKFDSGIKNQISSFIDGIYNEQLPEAGDAFNGILESWSQRISFNTTVEKLEEKSEKFNNTFNILQTKEFDRFMELSENISNFLKENKDKIVGIPEIANAIRLAGTISEAFNLPRVSLDSLESYEVNKHHVKSIYEMVCSQELVKKEILESKKSFENVWISEPCISNLATKIFESEDEIAQALIEAFIEIPYISLISKSQLSRTISNSLKTLHEDVQHSKTDLKDFVSLLFEMKKPLKELVGNILHEKYGVNINNLKEVPTFKTLINTQSHIFECLAKIAPRSSVIKETLANVSEMLKGKNGVEAIDVNAGINYLFTESGLSEVFDTKTTTFKLNESLTDNDEETRAMLMELIGHSIEEAAVAEPEAEQETEPEEQADEEPKSDAISTQELMKMLSDIEDMVEGPEDLEDE